jgi:hypothetical protein
MFCVFGMDKVKVLDSKTLLHAAFSSEFLKATLAGTFTIRHQYDINPSYPS